MSSCIALEVKTLGSSDLDLDTWVPADAGEVLFVLDIEIGEHGDERADLFYVTVATPVGLRKNRDVPTTKAGPLVVPEYSLPVVRRRVEEIVGSCAAESWAESVKRLQEHFDYEYGGYTPSA